MKILPLEQILDTCDSVQDGQFDYTLSFTSMEERTAWLHYYNNLIRYYCELNVYKTQSIIVASLNYRMMNNMMQ
jgi:hypothetical protein